jgi:glutamate carboxypeptidase
VVTIEVFGVSAHAGVAPEKGRSAILEAADKVRKLEALNDVSRGKLVNVGLISGGSGENVIADYCRLNMGIRFPSLAIKEELFSDIQRITREAAVPDTTATMTVQTLLDSMDHTDGVKALFAKLQATARRCGYGEIEGTTSSGVSDSGTLVACGVPTICGMGPRGFGSHSPEECAVVESMFDRSFLVACAVWDLD